jgi:hypothetical protein
MVTTHESSTTEISNRRKSPGIDDTIFSKKYYLWFTTKIA